MDQTFAVFLMADIAFGLVASLTWFCASRPRLFIRCFVPADELWAVARQILRTKNYATGMRFIAILQFGLTGILVVATLAIGVMASRPAAR